MLFFTRCNLALYFPSSLYLIHSLQLQILYLKMNFTIELEYDQFLTNLKSEEVLKIVNECLADPFASFNAELTEMTYDPLYDEFLPHGNASHMWKIEFTLEDDDNGRLFFNYETFYVAPRHEILISFLEGTNEEPSFIDFTNNSNVRSNFCNEKIFQMKYLIKKEEQIIEMRYAEREPLLLLINGSVVNYHNFNDESIQQINNEKITSKKRCVLENPWFHREVLELLDNTETIIPNSFF